MESKVFRMQLSTFKKIRRIFPARKNETTAEYFKRLVEKLEEQKWRAHAKLHYNKYDI